MSIHSAHPRTPPAIHDNEAANRPALQHPAKSAATRRVRVRLPQGLGQSVALVAVLVAYGVFLILGTFAHTNCLDKPFKDLSFGPRDLWLMLTCWTWTNLLILCCLSSIVGELGRRALGGPRAPRTVRAAIAQGFFVWLAVMAGQLVVLGTPAASPVPPTMTAAAANSGVDMQAHICLQHFFRIAGFASLLAFVCGIDPGLLRRMIDHLENLWVGQVDTPRPEPAGRPDGPRSLAARPNGEHLAAP